MFKCNFNFRSLIFDDLSSVPFFVRRKANSSIEQLNYKGHEKRGQFRVSKVEFYFQISQGINHLFFDSFLKLVFSKKV